MESIHVCGVTAEMSPLEWSWELMVLTLHIFLDKIYIANKSRGF